MYFNNAGWLLSALYPSLIWRKQTKEKVLYLTFDDGPIPDVTEYVLDELKQHKVKSTFFCVGDNVLKHPHVFDKIITDGHAVANHTFNHLNGWKTTDEDYLANIAKCDEILGHGMRRTGLPLHTSGGKKIFRPPYGMIRKSQIRKIRNEYQIVMWDVLTGDFSKDLTPEKVLHKAIRYSQPGSIVIFHDSIKAEKNLRYALPRYLDHFLSKQYRFELL